MSNKINIKNLKHKLSECNENVKTVNMINALGAVHIKNGTMTQEMYRDVVNANVIHASDHVATVKYESGYLDGYQDCQKDTVNAVLAGAVIGAAGFGIIKYRKEIKAYGKYVIGKLTKRGDK